MANRRAARRLVVSLLASRFVGSCYGVDLPSGDPGCAFDGSGCQATVLVFGLVPGSEGRQAILSAGAGVPQNAWTMSGEAVAPDSPTPAVAPRATARSIRVSQDSSVSGSLELKIENRDGSVASTISLAATEQPVELEAGTYTLRLSPGTTTGQGEFVFAICAGGC